MLKKNQNEIIRVLMDKGEQLLIIDCIKRTMPKWVEAASIAAYEDCSESELYERAGMQKDRVLTEEEKRIAQERYTMIAGVLPFIGNEQKRSQMIGFLSEEQSKQTIRKYLCLYLAFYNMEALAPQPRAEKELSFDEKNMRWALNKFFYTKNKNSLHTAYTMMLKEKYCSAGGQLTEHYPSFDQFRYFYRKTKKMQKFFISRDGIKDYQRNNRPLLGDGVRQYAPTVGTGMLDSTVCDIYLVDEAGQVVGRPVMSACIDALSGMCYGYYLGWEGGTYSLRGLMLNVIANKQQWCKERGVFIRAEEWNSDKSIVRPVRLLFGRDLRSITPQQRTILRNKNYIELLVFGIDCQEILDHGFASIKNQNEYIRKNGVTEELLEKYRRTIKKIEEE